MPCGQDHDIMILIIHTNLLERAFFSDTINHVNLTFTKVSFTRLTNQFVLGKVYWHVNIFCDEQTDWSNHLLGHHIYGLWEQNCTAGMHRFSYDEAESHLVICFFLVLVLSPL